jgi:hypothetical protein
MHSIFGSNPRDTESREAYRVDDPIGRIWSTLIRQGFVTKIKLTLNTDKSSLERRAVLQEFQENLGKGEFRERHASHAQMDQGYP